MKYSVANRLSKAIGQGAALLAWFQVAPFVFSQVQVLVSYEDEMLPVVAMSGSTPIVEIQGERMLVPDSRVRAENADGFTDGAIEVLERNAIMGQDYGSPVGGFFFRFVATVRAERDFEDCYVLFIITPEKGENTYLLREIPDINTRGTERILITLPTNPGFGGGAFAYHIFSKGQEIRRYEPDDPIVVDGADGGGSEANESRSRRTVTGEGTVAPAKVLKARLLDFPESLRGKTSGGYATAIYSIDREGRVIEFLDFAADHVAFLPEVWKTVVESQYEAGTFGGEPLVATVRQSFFFNEFAPFSEALEMIPYPEMKDRAASPLYAPVPEVDIADSTVVRLELLVDRLGRVQQSRVVEGGNSRAAERSLQAVEKWIFLPAVADGFPVDQTVTVPIAFEIKE